MHKNFFTRQALFFSLAFFWAVFLPVSAFAQGDIGLQDCPEGMIAPAGSSSNVCIPSPVRSGLPINTVDGTLINVLQWLLTFLAALSILVIIFAGITYITSGGNEDRIETAKKILIYAVIGLIVALLGYVIVAAVSGALGAGVS